MVDVFEEAVHDFAMENGILWLEEGREDIVI